MMKAMIGAYRDGATKARVVLLAAAVGAALPGCAGRNSLLGEGPPYQLPFLLRFTDSAARSMGLPLLRESALPESVKEVRVWTGFGTVQPDFMLRFQITADGPLTGTLLAYAIRDPSDEKYDRWIGAVLGAMCSSVRSDVGLASCAADASREIRWKAVYRNLVADELWNLPDESELPKPKYTMSDGSGIVVELRDGRGYRAYEYLNPGMREGLAARRAVRLQEIAGGVVAPVFARASPEE